MAKLPDDRRAAFTAAYRFYEQHWDMPDTVEAWTEAASQLGPVSKEHGDTPLIRNLLMACYQTIDDENADARKALRE